MNRETIFKQILDSSFKIHKNLGPGLFESVYEACLLYELEKKGLKVQKQKVLPLIYEGVKLDAGYRIDLFVENSIIIEIKSIEYLADIHLAQILTYMRLAKCKLGLLVNFNSKYLTNGIKRVIF